MLVIEPYLSTENDSTEANAKNHLEQATLAIMASLETQVAEHLAKGDVAVDEDVRARIQYLLGYKKVFLQKMVGEADIQRKEQKIKCEARNIARTIFGNKKKEIYDVTAYGPVIRQGLTEWTRNILYPPELVQRMLLEVAMLTAPNTRLRHVLVVLTEHMGQVFTEMSLMQAIATRFSVSVADTGNFRPALLKFVKESEGLGFEILKNSGVYRLEPTVRWLIEEDDRAMKSVAPQQEVAHLRQQLGDALREIVDLKRDLEDANERAREKRERKETVDVLQGQLIEQGVKINTLERALKDTRDALEVARREMQRIQETKGNAREKKNAVPSTERWMEMRRIMAQTAGSSPGSNILLALIDRPEMNDQELVAALQARGKNLRDSSPKGICQALDDFSRHHPAIFGGDGKCYVETEVYKRKDRRGQTVKGMKFTLKLR